MALVGVVLGSKTDASLVQPGIDILEKLGIEHEVAVISAHRNPEKVREYGLKAEKKGLEVIIAAAGYAAHLPGVLASWTTVPVIGVPLPTSNLKGIDALLSIIQMPPGVPLACVGIDGARNAALLAARILGIKYDRIKQACNEYAARLAEG